MSTDLTIADVPSQAGSTLLTDFRGTMMTISAEQMPAVFAEFDERRQIFRQWLMGKLKEGVHYGYPPGCRTDTPDPTQWQPHQSLYKAGADFLCELMGWRCEFAPDVTTWEMLGKPPCVCIQCVIVNGAGKEVGQGRGARSRGEKKMADNATIKMAEKCAKVNAVINALNLSDLFTQDIEDDSKNLYQQPAKNPNSPRQAARSERVTTEMLKKLVTDWKTNNQGADEADWNEYVFRMCEREFAIRTPSQWTLEDFTKVRTAVDQEVFGDIPY